MHSLLQAQGLRQSLIRELPAGVSALLLAEFYYKFHSFTLECLAFLATWFVFGWILSLVAPARRTAALS